ncbi:hypothetical protein G7Z17_g2512 [Cylindrodendrum hubeiense]|uniref:Uncharacterized protein n=1 Tax=Cylindrodendrum hubeiense TaxID=595255 RepID=A0A9P5LKZ4_9HYPO|nr:hypothetical protein G7Z17_g2512 [Cylindrodendrum hubeiense]
MVSIQEVAIVTGAAGGLGRAIARKLASRGITILIADVQEERGQETAEAIKQDFGVESLFCKTDVTKEEDVKRMVQMAVERWGRVDWAANNAGMGEKLEDNEDEVTTEAFNKLYEVNQRGVWLCQKYEAEQMRKQQPRLANGTSPELGGVAQRGAIVNIASICGHVATGMPSYTASKHAILGITKIGGLFYGKHGIRCNSVSPGPILSDQYAEFKESFLDDPRFSEQAVGWSNRCPLKRPSTCEEQANVVSFLLSGESSFVNCSDIRVDGGLTSVADR